MSARLSAFAALNNSDSDSDSYPDSDINSNSNSSLNDKLIDPQEKTAIEVNLPLGNTCITDYTLFDDNSQTPIVISNITLVPNQNIFYFPNYQLIGLQKSDILILKGQYQLSTLQGSIEIDSCILKSDSKNHLVINASSINSLPYIRPLSSTSSEILSPFTKSFQSIIKIENINDNFSTFPNLYPHIKYLYVSDNSTNKFDFEDYQYSFAILLEPETNKYSTLIPTSWKSCIKKTSIDFKTSDINKTVLIIGNKNTGKTTFMKILTNTLLSNEDLSHKKIQILDIDPGQPELCLPGCISLSEISTPLIGTIESFKINKQNEIIKYLGFNSPNIQPLNYLCKLNQLLDIIENNKRKDIITLINSPGWVKGFGAEIISHIASSIPLSYLIQLSNEAKNLDILTEINWHKQTNIIKLHSINKSNSNSIYSPSVIRTYKLLSYIHYDFKSKLFNFDPLIFQSPYRISYLSSPQKDQILNFKGIIGVSIYDSYGLLDSDLSNALECQYMALMTISQDVLKNLQTNFQTSLTTSSTDIPIIFDESYIQASDVNFYGLCIVHSVDLKNKLINIYTPIDLSILKDKLLGDAEKLILVKGREDVPMEEIYSSQIIKGPAQYWESFGLDCLPYVSSSLTNDAIGGKTVGIRRNIQRR
jgi:polynucleotide 5'-hydroxyl-kinase GRC3/NOL9